MTKAELVALMAKSAGVSKASAARAMQAFLDGVLESLSHGRPVTISGFGTFVVGHRAARNGRDPRTGEKIALAGGKVPR
ncbi:MAG TPA: HU family DNA-binding protein, partial [Methylomirabilota bacterium]|nr:HU family DNA-binding protein [Methylomirabilota bacterium]